MEVETSAVIDEAQNKILCSDTDASACQTVVSARFVHLSHRGRRHITRGIASFHFQQIISVRTFISLSEQLVVPSPLLTLLCQSDQLILALPLWSLKRSVLHFGFSNNLHSDNALPFIEKATQHWVYIANIQQTFHAYTGSDFIEHCKGFLKCQVKNISDSTSLTSSWSTVLASQFGH